MVYFSLFLWDIFGQLLLLCSSIRVEIMCRSCESRIITDYRNMSCYWNIELQKVALKPVLNCV